MIIYLIKYTLILRLKIITLISFYFLEKIIATQKTKKFYF
jgi:hypothetical protein